MDRGLTMLLPRLFKNSTVVGSGWIIDDGDSWLLKKRPLMTTGLNPS